MIARALIVIISAIALLFTVASHARAQDNNPFSGATSITISLTRTQTGMATWYGSESGRQTSSGARFNPEGDTCAMRSHAYRWVTVTVVRTGKSARCYQNDYGPARHTGNLIDVSHGVARRLGMLSAGRVRVVVE